MADLPSLHRYDVILGPGQNFLKSVRSVVSFVPRLNRLILENADLARRVADSGIRSGNA